MCNSSEAKIGTQVQRRLQDTDRKFEGKVQVVINKFSPSGKTNPKCNSKSHKQASKHDASRLERVTVTICQRVGEIVGGNDTGGTGVEELKAGHRKLEGSKTDYGNKIKQKVKAELNKLLHHEIRGKQTKVKICSSDKKNTPDRWSQGTNKFPQFPP